MTLIVFLKLNPLQKKICNIITNLKLEKAGNPQQSFEQRQTLCFINHLLLQFDVCKTKKTASF